MSERLKFRCRDIQDYGKLAVFEAVKDEKSATAPVNRVHLKNDNFCVKSLGCFIPGKKYYIEFSEAD